MNSIQRKVTLGFYFLLLSVIICGGCRSKPLRNHDQNYSQSESEIKSVLGSDYVKVRNIFGPEYDKLPYSQQLAFERVCSSWELDSVTLINLMICQNAPILEEPEFWVEMIKRDDNSAEMRAHSLRLLFLRHLKPGDPLAKLSGIKGIGDWFVEDETFASVVAASYLPIGRSSARGMYAYVPEFADTPNFGSRFGIVFSTPRDFPAKDIIAVIKGERKPDPDMYIVDLSVY